MWLFGDDKKKKKDSQGSKPAPKAKAKSLNETIKEQKQVIELLEKKQQFLQKKIELCEKDAREKARNKDKRGAMQALKRKNLMTNQLTSIDNQIMTLECQTLYVPVLFLNSCWVLQSLC